MGLRKCLTKTPRGSRPGCTGGRQPAMTLKRKKYRTPTPPPAHPKEDVEPSLPLGGPCVTSSSPWRKTGTFSWGLTASGHLPASGGPLTGPVQKLVSIRRIPMGLLPFSIQPGPPPPTRAGPLEKVSQEGVVSWHSTPGGAGGFVWSRKPSHLE